jgi:CubicO group peptidase (beta-lactamase class C family)
MIKIGNLILDKGEYIGRRIVSQEWIDRMTTQKIALSANTVNYASPDTGMPGGRGQGPRETIFLLMDMEGNLLWLYQI